MKQVIMGLSARQPSRQKAGGDSGRPKSASLHLPRSQHHSHFELHDDMDVVKPGPLSLVSVLVGLGVAQFLMSCVVKPGPLSLISVLVGVGVAQFLMSRVVKSGPLSLVSLSVCAVLG